MLVARVFPHATNTRSAAMAKGQDKKKETKKPKKDKPPKK